MKQKNKTFLLLITLLSITCALNTSYAQDLTDLGGDLSTNITGPNAIQVNAPNISSEERRLQQLSGFGVFHNSFLPTEGLGPRFINSSCAGCHVNNGRGPARFTRTNLEGSTMVVKVGIPGKNPDGSAKIVPGIGEQLQDHASRERDNSKQTIRLRWQNSYGTYADGRKYTLRSPLLSFSIYNKNYRKFTHSLRMTPMVFGVGLLEAIPESTILALSDPNDLDKDGISGKPNYVIDKKTGTYKIGRFGFKATKPDVEQQSSTALLNDMGLSNSIDTDKDGKIDINDDALNILTLYQKLAGVPRATMQADVRVNSGKAIFQRIGCNKCHIMTLRTENYIDPELSNQEIHPFTDLLLHDMGRGLADNRPDFSAKGSEWRTTPLWGLGYSTTIAENRPLFLHDGRAKTVEEAILWHDGEARSSQRSFKKLSKTERDDLVIFLKSL